MRNRGHGGSTGWIERGRSGVRRLQRPGPGLFSGHQWTGGGSGSSPHAVTPKTPGLQVVASGLNQPHNLTIGPDGNLYVAEAGDGVIGAGCVTGNRGRLCQQLGHHRPDHATGRGDPRGHRATFGWESSGRVGERRRGRCAGRQRQDLRSHPEPEHRSDDRPADLRLGRGPPRGPGQRPSQRWDGHLGGQLRSLRGGQQSRPRGRSRRSRRSRHRQRSLRRSGLQRRVRRRRCGSQRRAVRQRGGADLDAGRTPPDLRADDWWAGDGPAGPHLLGRRARRGALRR